VARFNTVAALPCDERLLAFETHWNLGSPSGFGDVRRKAKYDSAYTTISLEARAVHHSIAVGSGRNPSYWPDHLPTQFFPVVFHPSVAPPELSDLVLALPPVRAATTASQRTFAVFGSHGGVIGYAKLHHPGVIGRFSRALPLYQWVHSLEVARTLSRLRADWPADFSLMIEYGGTYVQPSVTASGFGTLYRSNPVLGTDVAGSPDWMIPAFSLMGSEDADFESASLLDFVLSIVGDEPGQAFMDVIAGVVTTFTWMACSQGLIPEFNAQNLLFLLDTSHRTLWVCVRDMADVFQDLEICRSDVEGPFSRYKAVGQGVSHDLHERRSFAFDFKLGTYVLLPLAQEFCRLTGASLSDVVGSIRDVCRQALAPYPGYFGSDTVWWGYPQRANVGRADYEARADPLFR
jgi:hypothetical protein